MRHWIHRRSVLKQLASGIGTCLIAGRTLADSANSKLRTAHIGVGGMGAGDLASISSHSAVQVAALCDVDTKRLDAAQAKHPHAKAFSDYREMLTSMGDSVDAVVVSTPDHTHAPAAMLALNSGKAVYCQKPLTHEVFEARQLRLVAESKGIVTQMGIQARASQAYRRAVALIQEGFIGKVSHVHAWSNKNWGYDGPALPKQPVPENPNWDLWLGVAGWRDYTAGKFHPGDWRRIIDFGTGTLGDMGVHIFDTPFAALELNAPLWVKSVCRSPTGIGHPEQNIVQYEFPGTKHTSNTLQWTWYDGANAPPQVDSLRLPAEFRLPDGFKLPPQGSLMVGQEGMMLLPHVSEPSLYPVDRFDGYRRPQLDNVNHYHQWVDACMGKGSTSASFSYAGPLTEALLLGVVANRFPRERLNWDADDLRIKDHAQATALLKRSYRPGFEVPNLG